jgi:hypothetical protein
MERRFFNRVSYYGLREVSGVARGDSSRDAFSRALFSKPVVMGEKAVTGVKGVMSLDNWPDGESPYALLHNDTDPDWIDRPFEDRVVTDLRGRILGGSSLNCECAPKTVRYNFYLNVSGRKRRTHLKANVSVPDVDISWEGWKVERYPDGTYSAIKKI